jgi:hypothetical protein
MGVGGLCCSDREYEDCFAHVARSHCGRVNRFRMVRALTDIHPNVGFLVCSILGHLQLRAATGMRGVKCCHLMLILVVATSQYFVTSQYLLQCNLGSVLFLRSHALHVKF